MCDFRLAACNHFSRTLSHSLSTSTASLLRNEGLASPLLVYSLRMCIRAGSLSSSMSDSFSLSDSPSLIPELLAARANARPCRGDRKSTRLNSSHLVISYAVFCLKKKSVVNSATEVLESNPTPAYYPATHAPPRNGNGHHQNGKGVHLSMQAIVKGLPLELQPRVS